MTKPILESRSPESEDRNDAASAPVTPQTALPDSPLASQLPGWDLAPPHTLLVRRRPVKP